MAWALNPQDRHSRGGRLVPRRHRRYVRQQGDGNAAYPFEPDDLLHRSRLLSDGRPAPSPVPNTGGPVRTDGSGPTTSASRRRFSARSAGTSSSTLRMSAIGREYLQRDGTSIRSRSVRRFDPAYRDPTLHADATRTRVRCRTPSCGRSAGSATSISSATIGWQTYDSLQLQVTRRFTGRFEMAGSYTWAEGYEDDRLQGQSAADDRRSGETSRSTCSWRAISTRFRARAAVRRQQGRRLDSRQLAHLGHQHVRHGRPWQYRHVPTARLRVLRRRRELRQLPASSAIRAVGRRAEHRSLVQHRVRSRRCRDAAITTPTATSGSS